MMEALVCENPVRNGLLRPVCRSIAPTGSYERREWTDQGM